MRRLAALMQYTEDDGQGKRWLAALRDDLQKLGWIEGRNLHIDYRPCEDSPCSRCRRRSARI
jgi:hypothetical protein